MKDTHWPLDRNPYRSIQRFAIESLSNKSDLTVHVWIDKPTGERETTLL